jgi:hypothetical protein
MSRKLEISNDEWDIARELYETDPTVTPQHLARMLSIPPVSLKQRAYAHGWLDPDDRRRHDAMMSALAVSGIVGKVPA